MTNTYIIIHKDYPINVLGINSGAETATLALARYLAALDKTVIVAGILGEGRDLFDKGVTYWDLGQTFNLIELFRRAKSVGPFHLISAGRSFPFLLVQEDPNCVSKTIISHDRSGNDSGMNPRVASQIIDNVVCVSQAQKAIMIQDGYDSQKCAVVYNGVDLDLFPKGEVSKRDYSKIVFSGALVHDKGIHLLLHAYAMLKVKYPHISLDVYGASSLWGREQILDEQKLETQLPGVKFHGKVAQDKLAQAFATAGVCVIPSPWFDPFPLTSLEAQVCGCPVIVSDAGGLPEGVEHGVTGLIVNNITAESLACSLDALIANPQVLQTMSVNALNIARQRFNWHRVAKEIVILCESVMPTNTGKKLSKSSPELRSA